MKKVLTIAGSDCSGGAGIQADIKTITAHKMYAMSAITALTAQNTTGVYGIMDATPDFVGKQLDCIFSDIRPDAVKIGMVSNIDIIEIISEKLSEYKATNIVIDPVMIATSGGRLLDYHALDALKSRLFKIADLITPNIPEAEVLCGFSIHTKEDMLYAAKEISIAENQNVLIKGGHLSHCADDLLFVNQEATWFEFAKIDNSNTHGTGCTLSSAIACNLAGGLNMKESVKNAKVYITGALLDYLNIGKGCGPLNHCYKIEIKE